MVDHRAADREIEIVQRSANAARTVRSLKVLVRVATAIVHESAHESARLATGLEARYGPPVLCIRDLRKSYRAAGERVLFAGVNLDVAAGECVAITGESGIGKSTLLNIVAGLDRPDWGSVVLEGVVITDLDDDGRTVFRRRAMGFVFQAFHLLPYLTVLENTALPLKLLRFSDRNAADRARALLESLGLGGREASLPAELSGGEQQRVALARALVHHPKLVLADEPTGNLDSENGARVLAQLGEHARNHGAAVLLVTHSRQAAAIADRVAVLTGGGLVMRSPESA